MREPRKEKMFQAEDEVVSFNLLLNSPPIYFPNSHVLLCFAKDTFSPSFLLTVVQFQVAHTTNSDFFLY